MNKFEQNLLAKYKYRPDTITLYAPANYKVGDIVDCSEFGEGELKIKKIGYCATPMYTALVFEWKMKMDLVINIQDWKTLKRELVPIEALNGIVYRKKFIHSTIYGKAEIVNVQESAFYDNQIIRTAHWYDTFDCYDDYVGMKRGGVYDIPETQKTWGRLNELSDRQWKFLPYRDYKGDKK